MLSLNSVAVQKLETTPRLFKYSYDNFAFFNLSLPALFKVVHKIGVETKISCSNSDF